MVDTKLGWFQGPFLCIFGSFLKVQVQSGDTFLGAEISKKNWGMPDIPDIFGVTSRCWA